MDEVKYNKLLRVMKQISTPSTVDGTFVRSVEWLEKIATDCLADLDKFCVQEFSNVKAHTQESEDKQEDHETTKRRLQLAHGAIKIAVDAFETVNMWEGDCGSTDMITCLEKFLPIPTQQKDDASHYTR